VSKALVTVLSLEWYVQDCCFSKYIFAFRKREMTQLIQKFSFWL